MRIAILFILLCQLHLNSYAANSKKLSLNCDAELRTITGATLKLLEMGKTYKGEEKSNKSGRIQAIYLTPEQLDGFRVRIKDGELIYPSKKQDIAMTGPNGFQEEYRYIYVMDAEGNLYLGPFSEGPRSFYHSTFLAGKPVAAAGEAQIVDGVITFNKGSGHYEPKIEHIEQMVKELHRQGLRMDRVRLADKIEGFEAKHLADISILKLGAKFKQIDALEDSKAVAALQFLYDNYPGTLFRLIRENSPGERGQQRIAALFEKLETQKKNLPEEAKDFLKEYRRDIILNAIYEENPTIRKAQRSVLAKDSAPGGFRDQFISTLIGEAFHFPEYNERLQALKEVFPKRETDKIIFGERLSKELEKSIKDYLLQPPTLGAIDLWLEILADPNQTFTPYMHKPPNSVLSKLQKLAAQREQFRDGPQKATQLLEQLKK